jgi:DNA-binding transcriptional LysR family regulator
VGDESVEKTRALARGEYGELHVGYAPVPTVEILPPALTAFQKAVPRVKVVLHDLSSDELIAGLHNARLELAIIQGDGFEPSERVRSRQSHAPRVGAQQPAVCSSVGWTQSSPCGGERRVVRQLRRA